MTLFTPEPNHPLTAIRRQGVVADVSNAFAAPFTVGVNIGGDTTTIVQCAYIEGYVPAVNDVVYMVANQGDYLVLGAVMNGPRFQAGSFTSTFATVNSTAGTLTYPLAFIVAPIVVFQVIVGANLDILANLTGVPTATQVAWRLFQKSGTNVSGTVTVDWMASVPQ